MQNIELLIYVCFSQHSNKNVLPYRYCYKQITFRYTLHNDSKEYFDTNFFRSVRMYR